MSTYVTTNIRLLEEDYLRLKDEAARKRKSLSAIIRDKVGTKKLTNEEYGKKLLSIKGTSNWFTQKDHEKVKKEIEDKLTKMSW